jgi:hypothetical protein
MARHSGYSSALSEALFDPDALESVHRQPDVADRAATRLWHSDALPEAEGAVTRQGANAGAAEGRFRHGH